LIAYTFSASQRFSWNELVEIENLRIFSGHLKTWHFLFNLWLPLLPKCPTNLCIYLSSEPEIGKAQKLRMEMFMLRKPYLSLLCYTEAFFFIYFLKEVYPPVLVCQTQAALLMPLQTIFPVTSRIVLSPLFSSGSHSEN
jgi:hypothetical protein